MLYFLTGITASGKSNLAHKIALEKNMSILSVDSMAVYKGLDILTAKPTDVMQAQVKYYGLDIADPDQNCLLYTSPSPRDGLLSRMPSSA